MGRPRTGSRRIDYPLFEPIADVDWLEDDEPLLSLTLGGETGATRSA